MSGSRLALVWFALLAVAAHGSPLFDQLKKEYHEKSGVELVAGDEPFPVRTAGDEIKGVNMRQSDLDLYLYMFRKEYGKYPPELLRASGLRRIVFCRDLTYNGRPKSALAIYDNLTIYLDVRSGVHSENFRRKLMHHEFYHMVDFADGGVGPDAEWAALNPPGFAYGAGDDGAGSADVTHPAPGFTTRYSQVSITEDKAELFSNLMGNDLKLRLLVQQDGFLSAKVRQLKAQLKQFCPQADEAFWARVAKS